MRPIHMLLLAGLVLGVCGGANASPMFDVIVPSHIRLTKSNIGGISYSTPFGFVAALDETISPDDLAGAIVTMTIDDPMVGVGAEFDDTYVLSTPVVSGEVVGWQVDRNTPLLAAMEPGETFRDVQRLWLMSLSKPGGYFGTATIQGSLTMGDQTAEFSIFLEMVEGENTNLEFLAPQRISSVPEPATMSLLALGGVVVLKRRQRE